MSRFFVLQSLTAYTPGEQPRDRRYLKLNTNESPFPPPAAVIDAATEDAGSLQLYSDPDCRDLRAAAAGLYGVAPEALMPVNGSDEALYLAFRAFGGPGRRFAFPAVSYSFYPIFAAVTGTQAMPIHLRPDFSIDPADYAGLDASIVIANPNAPTGLALTLPQIESILQADPDRLVIIDEAYVDFGTQSCVALTARYDNLLVTQTFSKSRSLAGARLGFAIGDPALIADLNTVRNSVNPYNVNRMTQAAGIAAIQENDYFMGCCQTIRKNRTDTIVQLRSMGFTVLESQANFVFARCDAMPGTALYAALRRRGVLVRHFDTPALTDLAAHHHWHPRPDGRAAEYHRGYFKGGMPPCELLRSTARQRRPPSRFASAWTAPAQARCNPACGFLDHMLTLFAKHGRFDLTLTCSGDTQSRRPPQRRGHRHRPGPGACAKRWVTSAASAATAAASCPWTKRSFSAQRTCPAAAACACRRSFQRKRSGHLTRSWWKNSSRPSRGKPG